VCVWAWEANLKRESRQKNGLSLPSPPAQDMARAT